MMLQCEVVKQGFARLLGMLMAQVLFLLKANSYLLDRQAWWCLFKGWGVSRSFRKTQLMCG